MEEISGVSYIFNQKFFKDLSQETGIDLENIVYYKDETHYFVMTAKKQNLLINKVLFQVSHFKNLLKFEEWWASSNYFSNVSTFFFVGL